MNRTISLCNWASRKMESSFCNCSCRFASAGGAGSGAGVAVQWELRWPQEGREPALRLWEPEPVPGALRCPG